MPAGEGSEHQQAACGILATEVGRAGPRGAALPPGSDSEGLWRHGSGASLSWQCFLGPGASPSESLAGTEQEVGGGPGGGVGGVGRRGRAAVPAAGKEGAGRPQPV